MIFIFIKNITKSKNIFLKDCEKSFEHFYDVINYLYILNHIVIINNLLNAWIKNNLISVFMQVQNSKTNSINYQRFDDKYHFWLQKDHVTDI
jgi:hypothetical protein